MNAPKNPPIQIDPAQNGLDRRLNGTPDDEISLLDVLDYMVRTVDFMIRKRSLILSVTIIFTLLAVGYALSITPMYKTTIGFLMPQEILPPKELLTKNTTEFQNIIKETKKSLYQKFLMKIQSYNFQREVFDSGNFLEKFVGNPNDSVNSEALVLKISKSITLTGVPAKNTELFNKPVSLEMEGSKPEAMAEFFNALVEAGINAIPIEERISNAIDQRIKTISSKKAILLSQEKKKLEQQVLQEKKKVLQEKKKLEQQVLQESKKRENEIARLSEELGLARSMSIQENNFKSDQPLNGAPRWYLYGAKILEEELKVIQSKSKKSDVIDRTKLIDDIKAVNIASAIRIENLNNAIKTVSLDNPIKALNLSDNTKLKNLDKELRVWESFKTLKASNVVVIDQPSIPPTQPIQNKKSLIIFTGLIAGLLFGSALAFFQHARRNLNARRNFVSKTNTNSFTYKHSAQTSS